MLKFQLRLLFRKKEFYYTLIITTVILLAVFVFNCIKSYSDDIANLVLPNQMMSIFSGISGTAIYFSIILPFLIAIPFADSYFTERENHTLSVIMSRGKKVKSYYFSKMAAVFVSSFLIILIPQLINFALNYVAFSPSPGFRPYTNFSTAEGSPFSIGKVQRHLFYNLFATRPYLYNLLFCFLMSFFGGLGGALTYALSFFVKKTRILALGSFFIIAEIATYVFGYIEGFVGVDLTYYHYFIAYESISGGINKYTMYIFAAVFILPILALLILTPFNLRKLRDVL